MESNASINKSIKLQINKSPYEKIHLLIHLTFYIALVMSSASSESMSNTMVSLAIALYFVFASPKEHFYFLVGFAPFELLARTGDISFYFVFLLISSAKLILKNINKGYNKQGIIALCGLVLLEALGDLQGSSLGSFVVNVCTIFYFAIFLMKAELVSFTVKRILTNFYISFFTVVVYVVSGYGSIGEFFDMVTAGITVVRFGHEEAIAVGGAMGIPLYSALLVSMSVSYYMTENRVEVLEKVWIFVACIAASAVGIFTISRSFILCMTVWFLMVFVSLIEKKRKRVALIIIIIICVSTFIYIKNADLINQLIENFIFRESNDMGVGSRGEIWVSCLTYLFEHPLGLLFGYGISRYSEIGESLNLLFSAKAHNLYIDTIMSVGLLGFMSFCILIDILKKKLSRGFSKRVTVISIIPIVVLLTFGWTALTLSNFKTWIYILMVIIFAYALYGYPDREEK